MSLVEDVPRTITVEELMAFPDDGFEREIIRDELREWPKEFHTADHGETATNIGYLLKTWSDARSGPKGKVLGVNCGFRLRRDPTTLVGIDVSYISPEMAAGRDRGLPFIDGSPVLAVEILSPSDKHEDIVRKVGAYLEVGTVVWVVDPDFRTVAIHKPGRPVETLNDRQELDGEPELPGFRVAVARLFDG